jgi:hypothetical protein
VPTIDLGDPLPDLAIEVTDSSGALANASAVVLTITLPDATTSTPTVVNSSTGVYTSSYVPTQRGRHVASWIATGTNASAFTEVYSVVDPAAAIVGLADAQLYLQVYSNALQDEVRATIEAASVIVENYTGRAWRRQTAVEYHDGGCESVALRASPVISVTSVVESGTTLTAAAYVLDTTSWLLLRGTTLSTGVWTYGRQNVVVTAVVGALSVPEPVRQAVLQTARVLWAERHGGTQQIEADAYAVQDDLIPRAARLMLDPYRAPAIA